MIFAIIALIVGFLVALLAISVVALAGGIAYRTVVMAAPYRCTRCPRPMLREHDYCPTCHYSTVEPRTSAGDGHE